MKRRVLTGITTTGAPHLGNYVGAIRPAIAASRSEAVESYYFLADYHALVKCQDPDRIQRSTLEIAATWLALGLDPRRVLFYRQSDIPEIPELTWLLTCVAGKGLLNRAHAYKASVDANVQAGDDPDAGISAGLFMYPVLMAADILAFNAHLVPVGRDQLQHIEIARDLAQRFNHVYGAEYFTLPEALIEDSSAVLPGLDGRKMSKSYDNTIPLWLPAQELKQAINGIRTSSHAPGVPKDPDSSHLFAIYQAFASAEESTAMRQAYAAGIGWGEAKERVFECIERHIAPARAEYRRLVETADGNREVEAHLQDGAARARSITRALLARLRAAVGLRSLECGLPATPKQAPVASATELAFKSYRGEDGRFYFKLTSGAGVVLLQSAAHAAPREAGLLLAALKAADPDTLRLRGRQLELEDGAVLGELPDESALAVIVAGLHGLHGSA